MLKRKGIIIFSFLLLFYLFSPIFFFKENYLQAQGQFEATPPNPAVVQKGTIDTFLAYFCHVNVFSYSTSWFGVIGGTQKLLDLLWCFLLYVISLPIRGVLVLIIVIAWAVVWLISSLASIVSTMFAITLNVSFLIPLNAQNIQGIGNLFSFTQTLGNALVLLAAVFIGLATVLRIEQYHIKKNFGKLIVLALLVNYSHWLVILAGDTSNKVAKPFWDVIVANNKSINIANNIWNEQNKKSVTLDLPFDARGITGYGIHKIPLTLSSIPTVAFDYFIMRDSRFLNYIRPNLILFIVILVYLFLFFNIFLILFGIFIYFSLYAFVRIFMLWILAVIA
ncbi:MAG: hypothetical protein ACPLZH_00460, partial [Minisyncoccales bacterium]